MPVACLDTGLDLGMLSIHAGNLADKIRHGEIVAQTAEEVDNAFREFAEQAANARADEIEVVEKMRSDNSPAELCDYLKQMIFDVQRLDLIDISKTVDAARKSTLSGTMEALDAALVPGANKIDIYNAMKSFSEQLREVINGLYPPGAEIGGEEIGLQGNAIMATVLFERPGLAGKLADFFSREDVKSDNLYNENSPAYHAYSFKYFLEHAHSLPDPEFKSKIVASLGTIQMPPFHAQALMEAFKAAGLGDLSVAEKMAMLRPSHQVGVAIAHAIGANNGAITPNVLRSIAEPLLKTLAQGVPALRSEADAERMEALLAKYGGGLSAADQARLREFAEALDFSEAAAPASEKALARRLDEICGGGGFANPASSASRRAIAAGATAEDLRFYVRCTGLLMTSDYTDRQVVEYLVDPQSILRRPLKAALDKLPKNISLEQKVLVAAAMFKCGEDADLQDIVAQGISRIIRSGKVNDVEEAVKRVLGNLRELREAAAGNADAFAVGKRLLLGLEARRIAPGFFTHIMKVVGSVAINPITRLKANSSIADIHAAISLVRTAGENILLSAPGAAKLLEGNDESLACRNFIADLFAARLTPGQRQSVHAALQGDNGATLKAFYNDIVQGNLPNPRRSDGSAATAGEINAYQRMAGSCTRFIEGFNASVGRLAGHNPVPGIRFIEIESYNGIRGIGNVNTDIFNAGVEDLDSRTESYLRHVAGGTSAAAVALLGVYADRISMRPFSPDDLVTEDVSGSINRYLDFSVLREVKRMLTSDDLTGTRFAAARAAGLEVQLPGGELLSGNPAEAREQLVRFATGRQDATWATLSKGERNKVAVLMALLTLESANGAVESAATALDRQGRGPAFTMVGGEGNARRVFRLDRPRNAEGEIAVSFHSEFRPLALNIAGEAHNLSANDRVKLSFECRLSNEVRERIENMDFSSVNLAPAEERYNDNPPPERRLKSTEDLIPEENRIDFDVRADFIATIA